MNAYFRVILICLGIAWALPASPLQTHIVATGLDQPLFVTAPVDDARLFIVEKGGTIKVLQNGTVLATPFLNLSALIDSAGERGLLGMAFDPGFATNRRFYVNYIDKISLNTVVAVYEVPTVDSNVANAASGETVITIPQPAGLSNHKAGWIGFRPGEPNNLYVATGDGGSSNDPQNRAQSLTDNLGKMLRIEVSVDRFPSDPTRYGYAIPSDNPFAAGGDNPEIYAYGLRNPFRNSFDRQTGAFYIADVGQGAREEINIGAAGANYGWRKFEGTRLNFPNDATIPNHTLPIHEYDHNGDGASITGGYVYRGSRIAGLQGTYFFADFVTNKVMSFRYTGTGITDLTDWTAQLLSASRISGSVSSFGEDGFGNLYLVSINGNVGKIVGALDARSDFNGDRKSDLLWRNLTTGDNAIWQTNGGNSLIPAVNDVNWRIAGLGNFSGSGRAGILWRNVSTGDNAIWQMDGFALASSRLLPSVTSSDWRIVGVEDFDGDGKSDILWRNVSSGDNAIWLMDGTTVVSTALIPSVPNIQWIIVGIGDFDGDGKSDILWRNTSTGETAVWLMNGFTLNGSAIVQAVPSAWAIAGVADYDGDGNADILWRNSTTGDNAIWLMNGVTRANSSLIRGVPDANWTIVGAGDYDGDGKADILWRNTSTGENAIWLMDGFNLASSSLISSVPDTNWTIIRH